ncbi:HNH endonuclease [Thermophilibacter sp.]
MMGVAKAKGDFDAMVVEALVTWMECSPSTITYGDLARRMAAMFQIEEPDPWRTFDAPLGRIQVVCDELSLPCLPVLVVRKQGMKPGVGFAVMHRSRHSEDEGMSDDELAERELTRVRECRDWQKVLDRYGIDHTFSGVKNFVAEERANRAYSEGSRLVESLRVEQARSPEARKRCLELKGTRCVVCGFDPVESWGAYGVIQVHHLTPLHDKVGRSGSTMTDPMRDLVPVCPNCHALIHSKPRDMGSEGCYTIDEATAIVRHANRTTEKYGARR